MAPRFAVPRNLNWIEVAVSGLLLSFIAVAAHAFGTLPALWLLLLSVVTFRRPIHGLGFLLLTISFDVVAPVKGIVISFSELELSGFVLSSSLMALHQRRSIRWDLKPLYWALPFLATVAISGLVNIPFYKVPPHVLRLAELFVAMSFAGSIANHEKAAVLRVYCVLVLATQLGSAVLLPLWTGASVNLGSPFSNINQFGAFLNLMIPLAFVIVADNRACRALRLCSGFLVLVALGFQVLLATRAALLASAVSVIGLTVWLKHNFSSEPIARRQLMAVVLVLCLALAASTLVWNSSPFQRRSDISLSRYTFDGLKNTAERRLTIYEMGFRMLKDHPFFGIGPGRYDDVYRNYSGILEDPIRRRFSEIWDSQPRNPARKEAWLEAILEEYRRGPKTHLHCLPLQLAVDFGLPGLAAFLIWVFLSARLFFRGRETLYGTAGLAILLAFSIHNLLDVTFPSLGIEMGLTLGIAFGLCRAFEMDPAADGPPDRRPFALEGP